MGRRLAIAAVLGLAGCSAGGASFAPLPVENGQAAVYVYTLDDYDYSASVTVDGRDVGRVKPHGHLKIPVTAGHHSVSLTAALLLVVPVKEKPVEFDLGPGQSVYFRFDGFRGNVLTRMPPAMAGEEIKTTRAS